LKNALLLNCAPKVGLVSNFCGAVQGSVFLPVAQPPAVPPVVMRQASALSRVGIKQRSQVPETDVFV
jgi:hypothetical protein